MPFGLSIGRQLRIMHLPMERIPDRFFPGIDSTAKLTVPTQECCDSLAIFCTEHGIDVIRACFSSRYRAR